MKSFLLLCLWFLVGVGAQAQTVTVATFNLDWWGERAAFTQMLQTCNTPNASVPDGVPPCNVYQVGNDSRSNPQVILRPTEHYWDAKQAALRATLARVNPDVVAFEEVSSASAASEAIGGPDDRYHFCESALQTATVPEAQRLVIAARQSVFKSLNCRTFEELRVFDEGGGRYTRPGLIGDLVTTDGKALKLIALHLKSRCASPAGDERFSFHGDLLTDTLSKHCITLRKQVAPLERLIEAEVSAGANVVMLGDFNRKINLELDKLAGPVREANPGASTDTSGRGVPTGADRVRLLWPEVNDAEPIASQLFILRTEPKSSDCRGFDGLDHMTVSASVHAANLKVRAEHVPMVTFGGDLGIPASDHCPLRVRLRLP